jgi:hypothetical protein
MVGFLQAQNCTNLVSSWRHPERDPGTAAARPVSQGLRG